MGMFFECVNFGNGNGKDLAGMGGIGKAENHSRTSLVCCSQASISIGRVLAIIDPSLQNTASRFVSVFAGLHQSINVLLDSCHVPRKATCDSSEYDAPIISRKKQQLCVGEISSTKARMMLKKNELILVHTPRFIAV